MKNFFNRIIFLIAITKTELLEVLSEPAAAVSNKYDPISLVKTACH